jgi:endonuclease-3
VTRSSLARFAYNGASNITTPGVTDNSLDNADSEVTFGSDIEDAIIKKATPATRKRKRTATELAAVQPSSRRATTTTTMTTRATTRAEIKTEIKAEEEASSDVESTDRTKPSRPRGRARKPARKTTDAATGTTTVEPPSDWEEIYSLVKEMRLTGPAANAAVDTMGCERLAHPAASARDRRFHTLVALMLSSQTKDTVNAEAMARLQAELPPHEPGAPPGLTLENMLAVDPAVLNELIGKVGFHNNKTK